MRISASHALPYHTSTPAFQCCPIQKEAVAFCASAGLPSVHLDYDRTLKALFIHASDRHCVVDLNLMLMSSVRSNTAAVKTRYREIARTKCVRTAEHHFRGILDELDVITHGAGRLEFSRDLHSRELHVAMRFPPSPEEPAFPAAQFVQVDKNYTHCEHDLDDDLTQLMRLLVSSPLRPPKREAIEAHDW